MTDIEERLADALNASYDAARALPLRPLSLRPSRPRRWVMLFAPVAAALAVVAVVTGLNALTSRIPPRGPSTPVPASTGPVNIPRYYVNVNFNGQGVIRSATTGTTIGIVRFTKPFTATTVTSVGGVFYIAGSTAGHHEIYQFKLSSGGEVTGLARVPVQGKLPGQINDMAVSPDGTKLAYTTYGSGISNSARITVISLPGGAQHTWQGGLAMTGYAASNVTSLSWVAGDEDLAFGGLWCQYESDGPECMDSIHGTRQFTEVRELDVAAGGSGLGQTKVLLRQSTSVPFIAVAEMSPDGATITAVVLSGPPMYSAPGTVPEHLAVRQFSTATGQPTGTLYQRSTGPTYQWLLTPDSTGRIFLLDGAAVFNDGEGPPSLQNKGYNGLLANGKFTNLPPHSGLVTGQAW